MNFSLTDDDFLIFAKALQHYATNEKATLEELSQAFDLAKKIEVLLEPEADHSAFVREFGEL